jgi:DNA-binding transcriptional ArsR family regulator
MLAQGGSAIENDNGFGEDNVLGGAEPNRRAILSLLFSSQQSVGEIERQLRMPQPTVSKHLRVLREAGFVESTVDAQRRLYRLKPEPLQEIDAWLAPFRRFWSAHVDARPSFRTTDLVNHIPTLASRLNGLRMRCFFSSL